MNVAYFLTPKCETAFLRDDYSFRQGLEKMKYHGYTAIPVINKDGKYIGTISEGDFLWLLVNDEYNDIENISVKELEDIKIKDVVTMKKYRAVSATAEVEELFEMALTQNFIPIIDDRGLFVGIVTRQKIIKHLCEKECITSAFSDSMDNTEVK